MLESVNKDNIPEQEEPTSKELEWRRRYGLCLEEFFGLDLETLSKLQERILSCKGHVRFFMHPVTLESVEPISAGDHEKVVQVFIETLRQNINNPKTALTFVLLPASYSVRIVKHLERVLGKKLSEAGCIVVDTHGDTGNLSLKYFDLAIKYKDVFFIPDEVLTSEKMDKHRMVWLTFGLLLSWCQVESGTCYGGFLGLGGKNDSNINNDIDRCLGFFIKCMRAFGKIKLDISRHVVYKDGLTRENFIDRGGNIKDTGHAGAANDYNITDI